MTNHNSLLEVRDLTASYMTRASGERATVTPVDHIDFDVSDQEIFGIMGESGCGKSTLAKGILRLLKPPGYIADGVVLLDGVDILKLDTKKLQKIRGRISYIPQGAMNSLNPIARVRNQIGEAVKVHERKIRRKKLSRRIADLLVSVGLTPEVAKMYPHELSGGMKQRVAIAMAIAPQPDIIVADEPSTALDVVVQKQLLQLLMTIKQELGLSIVIITHDAAVQAEICDRIAVMYAGKFVEIGKVDEIFGNPLHPYTQVLMSSVPSIKEKRELKAFSGLPPSFKNLPSGCRFHPRCPYCSPRCTRIEPELVKVKDTRFVACHLEV